MINKLVHLSQTLRSKNLAAHPLVVGILLLLISIISYGLVINRLGFYWDTWPMNWIGQTRGTAGLAQYFSTNRPVWGLLYQLVVPIVGGTPLPWLVLALILRWGTAMAVWGLLRLLWPRQVEAALWASLLFLIYPGFQQQSIALLYSHFFIVLIAFFLSLSCSLLSLRYPRWRIPIYIVGMFLSAVNLSMLEYFFTLEMLRPVLLWIYIQGRDAALSIRQTAWQVLKSWAAYLAVFAAVVIWRTFFFSYQTNNYKLETVNQFSGQPLQTLWQLIVNFFTEIWVSTGQAWLQAALPPDRDSVGDINIVRYFILVFAVALVLWLVGLLFSAKNQPVRKETRSWLLQALLLTLAALGLAGWPFLLTNTPFRLQFAFDRFTLPFMLGCSLLLTVLVSLLPRHALRWLVLALLVGLGSGFQYHKTLDFRQDWVVQQQFFWQLTWRIPHLAPGTAIIANENELTGYSTDNSLTAPLNWIYDPDNHSQTIRYLLFYPTVRKNTYSFLDVDQNTPIDKDILVATFHGSVGKSISIYFDGSSCLRVLDPVLDALSIDPENPLHSTMKYTDFSLIQPLREGESYQPPLPNILWQPPASSWCKLYESADLLRQSGKWYNILQLWDQENSLYKTTGTPPTNPAELAPFIEAYARTGQWEKAAGLTTSTAKSRPVLCSLWQNLDKTAPAAAAKSAAVRGALQQLSCSEYGIIQSQP